MSQKRGTALQLPGLLELRRWTDAANFGRVFNHNYISRTIGNQGGENWGLDISIRVLSETALPARQLTEPG